MKWRNRERNLSGGAKIMVCKEGKRKIVYCPISEIVLLLPTEKNDELNDKDSVSLGEECDVDWEKFMV
jgi:hypothetical protein